MVLGINYCLILPQISVIYFEDVVIYFWLFVIRKCKISQIARHGRTERGELNYSRLDKPFQKLLSAHYLHGSAPGKGATS